MDILNCLNERGHPTNDIAHRTADIEQPIFGGSGLGTASEFAANDSSRSAVYPGEVGGCPWKLTGEIGMPSEAKLYQSLGTFIDQHGDEAEQCGPDDCGKTNEHS